VSETTEQQTTTRRGFLDSVIYVCGTIFSGAMVFPAMAYLFPATRSGPVKVREEVGDADGWPIWESRKVSVAGKPVLVIKTDKGFVAYSAVCTHLGCLVEFDNGKKEIICPCHAASFDLAGEVVGGPPPRALAPYKVSEVQGKVVISL
jgi:cytochrome b6-f complex iron-sulfur subunit